MKFSNQFTVSKPVDETFDLLTDVVRIAPCMPGASVRRLSDDEYEGSVAVKVGPIKVAYSGVAKFLERNREQHTMLLDGRGSETRGRGSAAAQVTIALSERDQNSTTVDVTTDLQVTGKVAQFGGSAMADVSERLVAQFAANLATLIDSGDSPGGAPTSASQSPTPDKPASRPEQDATAQQAEPPHRAAFAGSGEAPNQAASSELDAFTLIAPLAKRALPAVGALALGLLIGRFLPGRRSTPARSREQMLSDLTELAQLFRELDRSRSR